MKVKEQKNKPVLRWAGGKLWMLDQIKHLMPAKFDNYFEPFVGGGSVFLNVGCDNSRFISDSNKELICFYNQVKLNLNPLLKKLNKFQNTKEGFYKIRESIPISEVDIAARFYFLNRTCFNGLYRVNQNGSFNVPFGYRDIALIDFEGLKKLQSLLFNTQIFCCDFEETINKVNKGDFVFLDPPYTVAHNKNGFIEYNQKIFTWQDQERLSCCVKRLIEKKAYFIMTNANHDSIRGLYKGIGSHFEIERYSTISGKPDSRFKISEIIITNCRQ